MTSLGQSVDFRLRARGRLVALVDYPVEGHPFPFELAVRPPGVRILAVDAAGESIWLTEEYRIELGAWDIRVPGGKIFDSLDSYLPTFLRGEQVSDDAVIEAAQREFREEVGMELHNSVLLGHSAAGATVVWDLHFVAGCVPRTVVAQNLEQGERIVPRLTPLAEVEELIMSGRMSEERAAIWVLKAIASGQLGGSPDE